VAQGVFVKGEAAERQILPTCLGSSKNICRTVAVENGGALYVSRRGGFFIAIALYSLALGLSFGCFYFACSAFMRMKGWKNEENCF
jgi:hypothetical protein